MRRRKPRVDVTHGCAWVQDSYGTWETSCGNSFEINEGTPHDNEMAYCAFCGLPIEQHEYKDDIE